MTNVLSVLVSADFYRKLEEFIGIVNAGDYHALKSFIRENSEEIDLFIRDKFKVLELAAQKKHVAVYALLSSEGFSIHEKENPSSEEDWEFVFTENNKTDDNNLYIKGKNDFDKYLVEAISNAQARTSKKLEQIHSEFCEPDLILTMILCDCMTREQLWMFCVEDMLKIVQDIIRFARFLPRLWQLIPTDQEFLVRGSVFELIVIRLSRFVDLSRDAILIGSNMLQRDIFNSLDVPEIKFLAEIFKTAKSIAALKLTEAELALYQSLVIFWPDRNLEKFHIDDIDGITASFNEVLATFKQELNSNRFNGYGTMLNVLLCKIPTLRKLSKLHMKLFNAFKNDHPECIFPPLVDEVFLEYVR